MKMKHLFTWFLIFIPSLSIASTNITETVHLNGRTMGTTYHVQFLNDEDSKYNVEQIHGKIKAILQDVNDKMSTYIPSSELSRFNKSQQVNSPIEISADLAKVIKKAIELNELTEGALDITVGPVVNLWGFGPEKRIEKSPTAQELAQRQSWVGIDKLKLTQRADKFYLQKSIPQLYVDLSSIAKGFGVDQVADYMENQGIKNYLVEIGGEIRAKGKNSKGKHWQIAIEKPKFDGAREIEYVLGLKDFAMATSGDYRNYFEENGKRFSHEINPKTGYPIQHRLASITVLAPLSMTADGLSTGLFVLGENKAFELAEKQNLPVYLIIKTNNGFETKMSSAFKKLVDKE